MEITTNISSMLKNEADCVDKSIVQLTDHIFYDIDQKQLSVSDKYYNAYLLNGLTTSSLIFMFALLKEFEIANDIINFIMKSEIPPIEN